MPPSTPPSDRYEAFLHCFAHDRDRIFAYVRSLLPHRADAEDVFQRCSILLWRKFDDYDAQRPFFPWACGVAFYEVRNFLRVAARDRLQFDDELLGQLAEQRLASLQHADRRLEALRDCLAGLESADRELIRAAYDDSQPLSALAEASGRALQTLYNRLSTLRRRLLECVERRLAADGGAV